MSHADEYFSAALDSLLATIDGLLSEPADKLMEYRAVVETARSNAVSPDRAGHAGIDDATISQLGFLSRLARGFAEHAEREFAIAAIELATNELRRVPRSSEDLSPPQGLIQRFSEHSDPQTWVDSGILDPETVRSAIGLHGEPGHAPSHLPKLPDTNED
ncbi:hypothetical protein [Paraburkholderia lycopersici]|uniref:Uncharacterized protein n=1 Tax=Paraburkholderia lycopersici TaxID=416944 RepID=A0A1G6Z270_9BURK|nr:hypothetical protein [Paraburkholderia lycopersici]SDD96749.1 hypothetical protein SAMN05421548_12956 [Paraburkholderia lycopersici]